MEANRSYGFSENNSLSHKVHADLEESKEVPPPAQTREARRLRTEEEEKQREIEREKIEDFGPTWYGKLRKKLWNLFEYPSTSKGAQVSPKIYFIK